MVEGSTTPVQTPVARGVVTDERGLLEYFGVDELRIVGAHERTVELPPRSSLGCPAHDISLKPDACSSCRLLAGEVA
jgi:hypothetical protein